MSLAVSEYETEKIESPLWLLENSEFVLDALSKIRRTKDSHTVDQVFLTVLKNLPSPKFGCWIQRRSGEMTAFLAVYIGENIYGEAEGAVWLLWCCGRASLKELDRDVNKWFQENGVKTLNAVDVDYTKAKERWFKRNGFKESYRVFERST